MAGAVVTEREYSRNGTSFTSVQVQTSFTPGTNNALLLVVWVFDSGADVPVSSIGNAAGAGNTTWAEVTAAKLTTSGVGAWRMYYIPQASAVATQPVVNFSSAVQYPAIYVVEVSGLTATPLLAATAQTQTGVAGGTDVASSGNTGTLSTQPAFVFGFCYQTFGLETPSAGTGYTGLTGVWNFEGIQAISARPEWKQVTSTAAVAATGSATNTSDYQTLVTAWEEGSAPVADNPPPETNRTNLRIARDSWEPPEPFRKAVRLNPALLNVFQDGGGQSTRDRAVRYGIAESWVEIPPWTRKPRQVFLNPTVVNNPPFGSPKRRLDLWALIERSYEDQPPLPYSRPVQTVDNPPPPGPTGSLASRLRRIRRF